jgi:hypothetical protein
MAVEEHEADATGYQRVRTRASCTLTRFRVTSLLGLLRAYWSFRRVRAEAKKVPGLLATLFLIEDRHTFYTLSLWAEPRAILEFNTVVRAHVWAANGCFRDLEFQGDLPQLWSAQFRLSAISPHNLQWAGVDLTHLVEPIAGQRYDLAS